jgi:hypothetical protein
VSLDCASHADRSGQFVDCSSFLLFIPIKRYMFEVCSFAMSLSLNVYTRNWSYLVVNAAGVVLVDNDNGGRASLLADKVVLAVTASMAVSGRIADGPQTSEGAGLVVDGKTELGCVALGQAEAVVAVTAGDDVRGQVGSANCAGEVGGVLAGELEAGVLNAVVLADVEVGDVDVLVGGWVRGRATAVSRVGAVRGLRSRGCESSGEEGRGDGEELHLERRFVCIYRRSCEG